MEHEDIQANLRAALTGIVAKEKMRLHQIYDDADSEHHQRVAKLRPIFQALELIRDETVGITGIEISLAEKGHMATVKVNTSTLYHTISISTNYGMKLLDKNYPGNTHFTVEEYKSYSFAPSDAGETKRQYENADEVLRIVMDAIGQHIASNQVLDERRQK